MQILVVKVGTSTLTDCAGRLDRSFLIDLTSQLAAQRQNGWDVILVTSGAIRAGIEALSNRTSSSEERSERFSACSAPPGSLSAGSTALPYKQAAAAIGQVRLMHTYSEAFSWRNIECAQVLLTKDDIADHRRETNARNTLLTLLEMGVLPIINENDTVAVDEIKFGDNDNLAALVAVLVKADLLLILSDVEGLYAHSPARGAAALLESEPIAVVAAVDDEILALARESCGDVGTGGMRTKVEAARLATESGIRTVVARGRRPGVIASVVAGEPVGTNFLAAQNARVPRASKGDKRTRLRDEP